MEQFWRAAEAFNRGDVEAFLESVHPDIEFIPRRAPVQGAYHGHAGVREFFADNAESFDVFEVRIDEVHEIGDQIVAVGTVRIKGKGSGAEVTVPTATVISYRDGKIVRSEEMGDRTRALRAAGGEPR
jgi:ketosteroid isomerase-like protein